MNAAYEDDRNNLRYAEYVLGVLDADARAAIAQEVASSDEAATAVARWQRHLMPLAQTLPETAPPEYVWTRILHALQWQAVRETAPRRSWLENLRLWQWIGIGASIVAAACVVVMLRTTTAPRHEVAAVSLMVSSIKQTNGVAGWTATMDLTRKEMIVLPATPAAIASNRSTQLWLIPAGKKPISVGVFIPDAPNVIPLSPALLAQLGSTAALAVSLEPSGGSPTGQPTGPVIAQGAISGAPPPQPGGKVALSFPANRVNATAYFPAAVAIPAVILQPANAAAAPSLDGATA
ncbi:anti-sigma factor [Dyella jejuensis]|uniref:Anti-sigma factor n=1 Tax=Dyella jejuensis TaxID=1432009 RepID=A0ABW8JQ68_9GAMM